MAASYCNPSYQRLKKLPQENEEEDSNGLGVLNGRRNGWLRLNRGGRWRRPRVRVPGLRRFLRRKARVVGAAVRVSVVKVFKRLMEGRPYLGEFFADNYMFMQVSPSPTLPFLERSFLPAVKNNHLSTTMACCYHPPSGSIFRGLLRSQQPVISYCKYNVLACYFYGSKMNKDIGTRLDGKNGHASCFRSIIFIICYLFILYNLCPNLSL